MFFQYPYTDMYALNLDWMIKAIKEVQEIIENLGHVVNTVNGQDGDVTISADMVNAAGINSVATLGAGVVFESLTQEQLQSLYNNGVRLVMSRNNLGVFDRAFFLTGSYEGSVTAFAYDPTGELSGVVSVNGLSGALMLNGANLPISEEDTTTIKALIDHLDEYKLDSVFLAGNTLYKSYDSGTALQIISIDTEATADSENLIYSGAVVDAVAASKAVIDAKLNPEDATPGTFLQINSEGESVWGPAATDAQVADAVTDWLDDNVPTGTTVVIDRSLTISDAAADAKVTGDEIADLKSALDNVKDALGNITGYPVIPSIRWTSGAWINESNGAEEAAPSYKASDFLAVNPDYGNIIITTAATVFRDTNRNAWYDENEEYISGFIWTVNTTTVLTPPPNARYMRVSAGAETNITVTMSYNQSIIDTLESAFNLDLPDFVDGYYINYQTGAIVANADYKYVTLPVNIFRGGKIKGTTGLAPNAVYGIAFYDDADIYISGDRPTTAGTYKWNYDLAIPENASFVRISLRKLSAAYWINPQYEYNAVFENLIGVFNNVKNIKQEAKASKMLFPDLRNGTLANTGNANAISTQYIIPLDKKSDYIEFAYLGDVTDGDEIGFLYTLFRGATDGMTSSAAMVATGVIRLNVNHNLDMTDMLSNSAKLTIPIGMALNYDHIAVGAFKRHDGIMSPLRIATDQNNLLIRFGTIEVGRPNILDRINHSALNARHAPGNPALLTLLHFSDLHHDAGGALDRIMEDAEKMATLIDDKICTGDMAANTAEQIASWWDSSVMTCIGNHETASYNASTGYNWTALSMADRDAYYIAPFESGWGITHTSGTSYYYKDYATQKVRLIVMDAMLYSGTPGAEATAQTAWLTDLLSDAITNDYHVLVAIHAPHGGATAKACSFSRYGQGTMPTNSDCNTPQTVIDTVATAITNGLHFIGYIVGHTHQDNIWDAEGDGSQLMYCVTCAAVNNQNQWKNSDQYRGVDADAYNLVTIDTTNMLVKLVRGGGADIDDHMRTREAICFNYSTGEVVGEVL